MKILHFTKIQCKTVVGVLVYILDKSNLSVWRRGRPQCDCTELACGEIILSLVCA